MKKKADEYLYNEALKYLGKYPATKKKFLKFLEKDSKIEKLIRKSFFQKISLNKNLLIISYKNQMI